MNENLCRCRGRRFSRAGRCFFSPRLLLRCSHSLFLKAVVAPLKQCLPPEGSILGCVQQDPGDCSTVIHSDHMSCLCAVVRLSAACTTGSSATTLCRRIPWNKRNNFRFAIVKAITAATDYQIEQLQRISYDEKNLKFASPCLILVDNFPENETRRLTEKITKRQIKCVILSTFPIANFSAISDFDMTPLRQLDEKEMYLVKDVLINNTRDSKRRRGAEEVLEREKRFTWFGLELFGHDYNKIEETLKNHIQSTFDFLGDSQEIHVMVLNFCCFLHFSRDGRAILYHPVVSDFLYEANEKDQGRLCINEAHPQNLWWTSP